MKCIGDNDLLKLHRLPPYGGSGLKYLTLCNWHNCAASPSIRREWIEINDLEQIVFPHVSPSIRREWIEMFPLSAVRSAAQSPSIRREWIEMLRVGTAYRNGTSPSIRREWIEIIKPDASPSSSIGLPPCGGSGLKCTAQTIHDPKAHRLPPCGGSGLKFDAADKSVDQIASPSVWREWIEIFCGVTAAIRSNVSLRVEGVD